MVTKENVLKIAELSRLKIADSELEKFTEQMNGILKFIERLKQLDTSNITPTSHATLVTNAFRQDEAVKSGVREKALETAPDKEGHFFRVPKVIG
ncbi:MAG: Asp-tRNA(Asn)/Glu-tRNA(Gln) amidotransferase subunit GatC [bacterium]